MHATTTYQQGVEYYVAPDGRLYQFKDGQNKPFSEVSINDLSHLRDDLDRNPRALKALHEMGINDPVQELEQYARCRYGGTNTHPDFIKGKPVNDQEYWECSKRGKCPYEGKICSPVKCGENIISHCELQVARLVTEGYRNSEIAWQTGKSPETIKQQISSLLQKIGGRNRVDIANFMNQIKL